MIIYLLNNFLNYYKKWMMREKNKNENKCQTYIFLIILFLRIVSKLNLNFFTKK